MNLAHRVEWLFGVCWLAATPWLAVQDTLFPARAADGKRLVNELTYLSVNEIPGGLVVSFYAPVGTDTLNAAFTVARAAGALPGIVSLSASSAPFWHVLKRD